VSLCTDQVIDEAGRKVGESGFGDSASMMRRSTDGAVARGGGGQPVHHPVVAPQPSGCPSGERGEVLAVGWDHMGIWWTSGAAEVDLSEPLKTDGHALEELVWEVACAPSVAAGQVLLIPLYAKQVSLECIPDQHGPQVV
jgi:hypothetical protein